MQPTSTSTIYFSDLADATGGTIIAQSTDRLITEILVNDQCIATTDDPIWFIPATSGATIKDRIQVGYNKGVKQFVIDRHYKGDTTPPSNDVNILQVEDRLEALYTFAQWCRLQYHLTILAIMGDKYSPIIKAWIQKVLSREHTISTHIDSTPDLPNMLAKVCSIGLGEYAIFDGSHLNTSSIPLFGNILQPTDGLFIEHLEHQSCPDHQQCLEKKVALFEHCHAIYYSKDDVAIDQIFLKKYGHAKSLKSWSCNPLTQAHYIINCQMHDKGCHLSIDADELSKRFFFNLPPSNSFYLKSLIGGLIYLLDHGISPQLLQASISQIQPTIPRITQQSAINSSQMMQDTHLNDLAHFKYALALLKQKKHMPLVVICSDLTIPPALYNPTYTALNALFEQYHIHHLMGIGKVIHQYAHLFSMQHAHFFAHVDTFLQHKWPIPHVTLFIKCGGGMVQETIVQSLAAQTHTTTLEVNLPAIVKNLAYFRSKVGANTKMMAMVKASAYGASNKSPEPFSTLQQEGIDYFGVAYIDEAIELRKQEITAPIMVMHATHDHADFMVQYQLEAQVHDLHQLTNLIGQLKHKNILNFPIHLKLETGMHRLGVEEGEIDAVMAMLKSNPHVKVVGILSHLSATQDPLHDPFTYAQLRKFELLSQYIADGLGIQPLRHMLNSHGVLRFPEFQFDMVRIGIGLYGLSGAPWDEAILQPVHTLRTIVSQIKPIAKGDYIGYDLKGIATRDGHIATLPIGYSDGLNRKLGSGQFSVSIHGHLCPIIGNICMDMVMVDISGLPIQPGDQAIIFDSRTSIEKFAASMGTMVYESLTQLSPRVKRIYILN